MPFGTCHWCRRSVLRLTRDHVIPLSLGGKDKRRNIVMACQACNEVKGNMPPEDWEAVMAQVPCWWRIAKVKSPRGRHLIAALRLSGAIR